MPMPEQAPPGGGLTPETLRALRDLGIADPNNPGAAPMPNPQMPSVPLPNLQPMPNPAPEQGGIMKLLSGLFSGLLGGTSAAELSNGAAMAPATPQALQEQRRRAAELGGQAPPQ